VSPGNAQEPASGSEDLFPRAPIGPRPEARQQRAGLLDERRRRLGAQAGLDLIHQIVALRQQQDHVLGIPGTGV